MSETDTFVSQEATELESSKQLLRLLAHGRNAGLGSSDIGVSCVYCEWNAEDYEAEPNHDEDCPIRRTRKFLGA